jgi:hypothetical protein
MIASFKFY